MELTAQKREAVGKENKILRGRGFIPAVLYGPDFSSANISVNLKEFTKIFKSAGESTVIDLRIDGDKEPFKVLIKDAQLDPITDDFIHADFYKANLSQAVSVSVPIRVIGESPVVKSGQGIVLTLLNELTVEALPLDLPHEISVDVSPLTEIGATLAVKDLPIDHTKIKVSDHHEEDIVVKIDYAVQLKKEEEVKSIGEIEVTSEKKEEAEGEEKEPSEEAKEKKEKNK